MKKINLKKIKINQNKVNFFNFGEIKGGDFLITNDFGLFAVLTPNQFKDFLEGKLKKNTLIYEELKNKGFLKNLSLYQEERLINFYRRKRSNLFNQGPSLHIMVVTLRCNFSCIYCQANSRPIQEKEYDMGLDTAKKTVDFIFETPSPSVKIMFQGGEPLVNWSVVKFVVEYARKKQIETQKKLNIFLVSNLTLMTEKKLNFLIENNVHICTSLDGPRNIHNKNRPWVNNDSYAATTKWIKKIREKGKNIVAMLTVTKESLKYPEEIINEYLKKGFYLIHLNMITYLGRSKNPKNKFSYSAEEFISFWEKAMDYIISANEKGRIIIERESGIMLQKIMTMKNSGYTDLDSPCGAVFRQITYNYNGKIYTCDEGRMIGDDTFLIGDITNSYQEIILNDKAKTMIAASCLENTTCDQCVYKPYCGICPVKNYVYYGNLFPQIINTDHCKIKKAQFNYLFSRIQDEKIRMIFEKWIKADKNMIFYE